MENRNYEILSGDTLVALWQDGVLTVKNDALLPLYLKRVANAEPRKRVGIISNG